MKKVSVFMDVEDPINPLADDAALDLAKLFTTAGVRGSFCITGEKCRMLKARDRHDVVEALLPHCLGQHTDTHSYHPTTMELLADVTYRDGCRLAFAAEEKGRQTFVGLFEREPAFWGGAGNTWSPEITGALQKLGIGAYSYALTALPNDAVHRFNGVFALPQALSISESDWADDGRASLAADRVMSGIDEIDQPWIGLFVGHPTRMRYSNFWDTPYNYGRTPPAPEFTEPANDEVYHRSKSNLHRFLSRLRERHEVIGVDDALTLPWRFREPTRQEIAFFEEQTSANLRSAVNWPIHRRGLSADNIVSKTMALRDSLEVAFLPVGDPIVRRLAG